MTSVATLPGTARASPTARVGRRPAPGPHHGADRTPAARCRQANGSVPQSWIGAWTGLFMASSFRSQSLTKWVTRCQRFACSRGSPVLWQQRTRITQPLVDNGGVVPSRRLRRRAGVQARRGSACASAREDGHFSRLTCQRPNAMSARHSPTAAPRRKRSTGRPDERTTTSATLPSAARAGPMCACVLIAIRSALNSSAPRTMLWATAPTTT
jgi:hypothetical protein